MERFFPSSMAGVYQRFVHVRRVRRPATSRCNVRRAIDPITATVNPAGSPIPMARPRCPAQRNARDPDDRRDDEPAGIASRHRKLGDDPDTPPGNDPDGCRMPAPPGPSPLCGGSGQ
jgi:hypothetical protein